MAGRARDFERGTDAACSFAHAREAETFFLTAIGHPRLHPDAIVRDAQCEIPSVTEADVKPTAARMHACISNGFVADAVDFIAYDGMHLLGGASDGQVSLDGPLAPAVVDGTAKRLG